MGVFNSDGSINKQASSGGRINWDDVYKRSTQNRAARYSYKQRDDKGFDFFRDGKKTTIEDFAGGRGIKIADLRAYLASQGDQQNKDILTKRYYENDQTVKAFNQMDVYQQRGRIAELEGLASRTKFNSKQDLDNRNWAREQLAAIQQAGQEKGGNPLTFAQDIIGGTVDTYSRAVEANALAIDAVTTRSQQGAQDQSSSLLETLKKYRETVLRGSGIGPGVNDISQLSERDKKIYDNLTNKINLLEQSQKAETESLQDALDPTKYAGAAAQIALDAATAGIVGKLVSTPGKSVVGNLVSKATNPRTLAGGLTTGAAIGTGYGAGATAEQLGADATVGDYLVGAGTGAIIGAGTGALVPSLRLAKYGLNKAKASASKAEQKIVSDSIDELSSDLISAAGAETNRYKKTAIGKFVQKLKETLNVTHELRKIDLAQAKRMGINVSELKKGQSLEALYDNVINYRVASNNLLAEKMPGGLSVMEVMQKHGNDVAEFNNYRNALAELVARGKGTKFRTGLTNADLKSIVTTYEKNNKGARNDVRVLNQAINKARRNAKEAGAITEELDARLGNSQYYTPVMAAEREIPKAQMGGRSVTRGDQQFAKLLSGPSDAPIDVTFTAVQNYIEKAYKNAAEAKLSQAIFNAHKQGFIKGSRVVSEAGAKSNKKLLKDYARAISREANKLQTKIKVTNRQARRLSKEINDLNKKGLLKSLAKENAIPNTDDPIKLIKALVKSEPWEILRIQKSIALREPRLAAKLNDVVNLQNDMSTLRSEARGARTAASEIVDDPTTNKSFIRGVDEFGNPYSLEVPPDLSRLLRGVDINPNSPVMRALLNVQRTFQTFWTGFANPVFNFITTPLYDAAANVNALIDNPAAFLKSFTRGSFGKAFKGVVESEDFQKALRNAGATPQGGSLMPQDVAKTAESIISRRNFKSRTGYLATHPKELLHALDNFSGKVGNITRTRLARGYYKNALKNGYSESEALAEAAFAYNNLAPNFQRLNSLSRDANAFIPYFSASVAGNRSLWQPILAHPGRAAAVYGGIASTFIGATAYNLSSDAGRLYYQQMRESDKEYVLDNNYVIVLPTASWDPDTGQWSGIIKIPIAPELRYMNRLAHQGTEQVVTGDSSLSPTGVASALLNTMTGGVPESVLQGPQIVRVAQILAGGKPTSNILTPEPLVPSWMADLPKEEQTYPWSSEPAKFFSEITGRTISPIQADEIIKQFGIVGRGLGGQSLIDQVTGKFTGSFTQTMKSQAYKETDDYKNLSRDIKANANGSVDGARAIATEFNAKVDSVITKVRESNMSDETKQELISNLEGRKASLKDSALKKRLE